MWIDLTHPVHAGTPVWEEAERARISTLCQIDENCPVRVSWIAMGAHTGTHVDAPSHFLPDGGMIDSLDLEVLIGPAWIADCGGAPVLTGNVLESLGIPSDCRRLLLRTSNTTLDLMHRTEFVREYVGLDLSGARWLLERNIRLVGLDYLSVQAFNAPDQVHRELLAQKVILVEGLDLSRVQQGRHDFVCLPFLGKDLDGAPARVVARPS